MDSLAIVEAARRATPLVFAPLLAARCGLGAVWVKDETKRPLGNFKVLGGAAAGLNALAGWAGCTVEALIEKRGSLDLPTIICASDGNHGLAVATGAAAAGARATVVLHGLVPEIRRDRIAVTGATIVTVPGTYDDAVDHAVELASTGEAILIPDTSDDADDPIVADVVKGYEQICREVIETLAGQLAPAPSHLFVQAGVGGLAAAMCTGIGSKLASPGRIVVIEPEVAACVKHALETGRVERIGGTLETSAEMLACGLASASAVAVLQEYGASCVTVGETGLHEAVSLLFDATGIRSTPSGATGLAGLIEAASNPALRDSLQLSDESTVLLICSEAEIEPTK
jgi:diaminopropionate ammonia-lyase